MEDLTLITIITLSFVFLGLIVKACLSSKCDDVQIGCLKVHRNVALEEKLEEYKIDHGVNDINSESKHDNKV